KHSRGVRSKSDGLQFGGNIACDDRSKEACMGGSGKILCRSGVCDDSVSAIDLKAICGRTTEADRPQSCCENSGAGQSKCGEEFGEMGGGMQPQGHVQVLINQIDFGLNVQEAGDASRWQHEGDNEPTGEKMEKGGYVEVESGIAYEVVRELEKRGHDMRSDI